MPNQPKTPLRTVRLSDELWIAVQIKAGVEGRTVSDVIRSLLTAWVGHEG